MRVPLNDGWTVRAVGGPVPSGLLGVEVPASVPGCVHTDLLAHGAIPDPYLDDNEHLLQWIGRCDWRYETHVDVGSLRDGQRVDLFCDGLDTIAEVAVNDLPVATTRNMHRSHRFDVRAHLREGQNRVSVTFRSPVRHADAMSLQLGARPHANAHPFNAIRKMACNFGWDWGPDLATSGIWRPIGVDVWRTARLAAVRPLVTVVDGVGHVDLHVDVERAGHAHPGGTTALSLRAQVGEVAVESTLEPGATTAVLHVEVPDPQLWWPLGHGDQPLYDVEVHLSAAGEDLDSWDRRIGFRSVRLASDPDEHGTSFALVVNDRPVFAKGANWIPDDVFVHRVTRQRYADRVEQAVQMGTNLLRVWGGGIYESDDFYDACDERGVLVWQDFLLACAAYAEEEPLRAEFEAEAREAVTRLAPHPSLAIYNGGNENLWGHEDWGWKSRLDERTWGLGYYRDLFPAIVAELDPTRPYTAGSPSSPGAGQHPNDPDHGTMHVWDVWNQRDYAVYRDYTPRFASEFGWQGPPAWATLTRSVTDDPITPESPGVASHQKATKGNDKLEAGLVPHFRIPQEMHDWHWAMSLNQARAVVLGVEHFRSHSPRCMGTIVWQLNDCWPVTSWAAVDGDGRRKPLFYALRKAYAQRLLTLQPRGTGLAVVAVNDTDEAWTGTASLTRRTFDGRTAAEAEVQVSVPARGTVTTGLPRHLTAPEGADRELVVAEVGGQRALWFFAEDRDQALPEAAMDATCVTTDGGYQVRVRAHHLVRDLSVLADKVDPGAQVDDMLLTLLPGESATFDVTSNADVDPQRFTAPAVLRCANQLVTPTTGDTQAPER